MNFSKNLKVVDGEVSVVVDEDEKNKINELFKDKPENTVKEGSGKDIPLANYEQMDESNKKAADVMASQGMEAAIKHMFTDQKTGGQMSYAEMRSRFG